MSKTHHLASHCSNVHTGPTACLPEAAQPGSPAGYCALAERTGAATGSVARPWTGVTFCCVLLWFRNGAIWHYKAIEGPAGGIAPKGFMKKGGCFVPLSRAIPHCNAEYSHMHGCRTGENCHKTALFCTIWAIC
jgi:hypothetical protein